MALLASLFIRLKRRRRRRRMRRRKTGEDKEEEDKEEEEQVYLKMFHKLHCQKSKFQ